VEHKFGGFVWDSGREKANIEKHGVNFTIASKAFHDANRKFILDLKHSVTEQRYYCIGKVEDKIMTVRFTYRKNQIRIFGAGYWRKGKVWYEEKI